MQRYLIILFIASVLFSCKNKTLDLPLVAVGGVSEIQNHSQIWVFYEFDKDKISAELNKNNTIGSTHWIINIDKRLPLNEVIPILQMIKDKRAKKSMHSIDGMQNYLSYSDILNKEIALFPIDEIQYIMQSYEATEELEKANISNHKIEFSVDRIVINNKRFSPDKWMSAVLDTLSLGDIQLYFNNQITYQDYMNYRLSLTDKLPIDVDIENIEYIIK